MQVVVADHDKVFILRCLVLLSHVFGATSAGVPCVRGFSRHAALLWVLLAQASQGLVPPCGAAYCTARLLPHCL